MGTERAEEGSEQVKCCDCGRCIDDEYDRHCGRCVISACDQARDQQIEEDRAEQLDASGIRSWWSAQLALGRFGHEHDEVFEHLARDLEDGTFARRVQ